MSTLTPILVSIRLIVHEILTKTATNLPADTAACRVAHRWVRDYQMLTIVYPTCLQNLKPIRLIVYDLKPKPIFQKIVYLTLTFDPMTLTSYQILAFIDVYPHTYFGFNPTNSLWGIDKNVRSLPTNGPTNQRTNQRTNQPTKLFIEMRRSRWTHLKTGLISIKAL